MDELNASPSSTESAADAAPISASAEAGTTATGELSGSLSTSSNSDGVSSDAGSMPMAIPGASESNLPVPDGNAPAVAASGETNTAPDAGAASDLSAPSVSAETAPSTLSQAAADGEGTASGEGGALGAGDRALADMASAQHASAAGTSSPSGASSLDSLPSRIAVHLESIYELAVNHVRQLIGPADVAKSELAVEIDDLLHKLSNGIAVSDGRIVAKLAALRSLL